MSQKMNDVLETSRVEKGRLMAKYNDRSRRFREVMEGIYGKEADDMPVTELIARHREVADKLLGCRKVAFDPFRETAKVSVNN